MWTVSAAARYGREAPARLFANETNKGAGARVGAGGAHLVRAEVQFPFLKPSTQSPTDQKKTIHTHHRRKNDRKAGKGHYQPSYLPARGFRHFWPKISKNAKMLQKITIHTQQDPKLTIHT